MRLAKVCCFVCLVLLAATWTAPAQTTFATITGTVSDPTGAMIPNAGVEAVHTASNYRYAVQSNDAGVYTLAQLRDGQYTLRVRATGFKEYVVQNIELVSRDQRRIDVRLDLGAMEATVEVSAGVGLIETETARISDTKDARALNTLPLNTRSLTSFLQLAPTVQLATGDRATIRFAGSRNNQENQSIDGISFNNLYDGTRIAPLQGYIESFQEVRVDSANNTAEFGAVGQVTVISKSGANRLHGSAFDYYDSSGFASRNPFSLTKGSYVNHTPGVSAGGPIFFPKLYNGKNKSFFFASWEGVKGSQQYSLLNPTVPLEPWRSGDFSALAPGTIVRDPMVSNTPFANNRIPATRINPVAKKIQDRFYPLPNFGDTTRLVSQNYRELKSRAFQPNTYWTVRGDHRFSEKAFLFGRLTWNHSESNPYEGNLPTIGQRWQIRDTRAVNISYTHNFRANLINELRWGLAFNDNPRHGPVMGLALVKDLGLEGLMDNLPDIQGLFKVSFSGLGLTGLSQQDWKHPGFKNYPQQMQEQLNWFRGRHTLKAGVQASYVYFADGQAPAALFGSATFSNRFTGYPYADFLLGIPTTSSRGSAPLVVERLRWGWDFFVADEFKVTPRLTLNLGLRYEYHPGWIEASGRQGMFDIGSGKIVVPDGSLGLVSPLLPRSYVEVVEAKTLGLPGGTLLRTDMNNFAPRIGVAWRPFGANTVLRAGYGVFYDVGPARIRDTGAFALDEPAFTNPTPTPVVVLPRVYPAASGSLTSINIPAAWNPDVRTPYSQQYNATIEHQQWNTGFRISFVGTNQRKGEYGYNINQPLPDTRAYVDKGRMFPRYPALTYLTNGAGHQYNSLTLEAERRSTKGLAYQASYVLARDIGDLEREYTPENAYDRRRERAVWDDIPTHRFTGNWIYELPFGKGRPLLASAGRLVNAIAGGWELSGIFIAQTGQFLTPLWTGADPTGTAFTSSRTPAQVTIRPDILRDANLPSGQQSVNRWFDVSAFAATRAGAFGTSSRGVIKGPGLTSLHTGLAKQFSLREGLKLRTELTATNVLNHPNWSNPATNISSAASAGIISAVGGVSDSDQPGVRKLRAGLRLEW